MAVSALPPGPRLPRWLQTAGFMFAPRFFVNAVHRRYGDLVFMRTLFDPGFVMVFEAGLIKQLFRGSPEQLRAGEANAVLGPVVGERSVLLLDGAEHLRHRKLLLPPFHGQRMRAYESVMREAADRAIDSWPVGEPFALLPSMQSLTLEVIARAVFGIEEGARKDELLKRIRAMVEPMSTRLGVLLTILSGNRRGARMEEFEQRRRRVDELIYDEIARRREAPDLEQREDVFSMLLLARDEDGNPMTDHELRDELVTLLVAGHETTATGLAWAFELLLRNPRVLEKTRAAIADEDDAYLDAVVKETLRIRPVISGIGRKVRGEPFELGGYTIPPGVEINPSISAMHRRADSYPQPEEFRPERFLEDDPPDTYSWIPFGGGTRRCLGASFASFEMRVVIKRVLERASLRPEGRRPERAVRQGITFAPRYGARAVMTESPRRATAGDRAEDASGTPVAQRG
jgi:cytochrome P450 family 135